LTLKGLMLHHGVDPNEFHAIFHDLSLEALAQDPELLAALERLPGRRLIFTNADDRHAVRVLEHLGLSHLFDDVFHIGSAGYEPKPSVEAFARMDAAHGIDPAATAFFEDSQRNLEPAAALGMTTVLVGAYAAQSTAPFVHHRTAKLAPFLNGAQLKKAA
jgi:putative hydrolase of the HAD superfamily